MAFSVDRFVFQAVYESLYFKVFLNCRIECCSYSIVLQNVSVSCPGAVLISITSLKECT